MPRINWYSKRHHSSHLISKAGGSWQIWSPQPTLILKIKWFQQRSSSCRCTDSFDELSRHKYIEVDGLVEEFLCSSCHLKVIIICQKVLNEWKRGLSTYHSKMAFFYFLFFICPCKRGKVIQTSDLHFMRRSPSQLNYLYETKFRWFSYRH